MLRWFESKKKSNLDQHTKLHANIMSVDTVPLGATGDFVGHIEASIISIGSPVQREWLTGRKNLQQKKIV